MIFTPSPVMASTPMMIEAQTMIAAITDTWRAAVISALSILAQDLPRVKAAPGIEEQQHKAGQDRETGGILRRVAHDEHAVEQHEKRHQEERRGDHHLRGATAGRSRSIEARSKRRA